MNSIEADGIELYFGNKSILNNIYFKAEKGVVTGILGSNGSGKSSLLKIIYGTLNPKYKSIRIDSKHISKPLFTTNNIKYLPQFHFLPDSMKVKTAFDFYNVSFDDFITEFESFKKYENQKFKTFSGGEKRIIEMYICLKSTSEIALLDEPFSHISPLYVEKIKELITKESQYKIIVITDHLYKHIIDLSKDIYLIKDGFAKKIKRLDELEFHKYASID